LKANIEHLDEIGEIKFKFIGDPVELEVHVFQVFEWQGLEKETEEMRPQWWDEDKVNGVNFGSYLVLYCVLILFALLCQVPFSQMWPDDEFWFPHLLRGERFKASFVFEGHDKIVESNIEA